MSRRVALASCALVFITLGGENLASAAQDRSAIEQMVKLNNNALSAYKARRHEAARTLLLDAEMLAETNGLLNTDMAARTYMHLGLVYLNGLKQKEKALRYFAQAFQIRPKLTLTRSLATSNVRVALKEAQRRQKQLLGASSPPPAPSTGKNKEPALAEAEAPPPPPAPSGPASPAEKGEVALDCPVPGEAPPAQEMEVRCQISPGARTERAFLFYRPAGHQEYNAVRMSRDGTAGYVATVPASNVSGRALEFYVEAEAAEGKVAATLGEETRPKVIALREGAPPAGQISMADGPTETPPALTRESGDEDLRVPAGRRGEGRRSAVRRAPGTFFLGVAFGSALGAHGTRPLELHPGKRVSTGLSFGGVHALPEIGIQYDERLAFSIQGRHQYIPPTEGPDTMMLGKPPSMAHAVLARVYYALGAGERAQFNTTLTVGGGSGFRLKVPPVPQAGLPSSDTISGGPLVFGPGLSLFLGLSESLVLASELRVLVGFDNLAGVAEGSLGLQYAF